MASLCTNQLKLAGYASQDYIPVPRRPRQENQECKVTWQTQSYMTPKKLNETPKEMKQVQCIPLRWEKVIEIVVIGWQKMFFIWVVVSFSIILGSLPPSLHPFLPLPLRLYVHVCVCRTCVDSSRVKQLFAYSWLKIVSSSVGEGHTLCPSTQLQEGHIGAGREEVYIYLARLSESALIVNVSTDVTTYLCAVRHTSKSIK